MKRIVRMVEADRRWVPGYFEGSGQVIIRQGYTDVEELSKVDSWVVVEGKNFTGVEVIPAVGQRYLSPDGFSMEGVIPGGVTEVAKVLQTSGFPQVEFFGEFVKDMLG